jgi:hypothetical protein
MLHSSQVVLAFQLFSLFFPGARAQQTVWGQCKLLTMYFVNHRFSIYHRRWYWMDRTYNVSDWVLRTYHSAITLLWSNILRRSACTVQNECRWNRILKEVIFIPLKGYSQCLPSSSVPTTTTTTATSTPTSAPPSHQSVNYWFSL